MRIDLNAEVRTADGWTAGSIQRAVFDPESSEVKAFLVHTGGLLGREVIVRREQIEEMTPDGVLRLSLTKDAFDRLETYVPTAYTAPPVGWVPPPGLPYPDSGYLWPAGLASMLGGGPGGRAKEMDLAPSVERGMTVKDRDGHDVGVLEEIRYAEGSGEVRGLVVKVGAALQTLIGSGTDVEVEREAVSRVADKAVHLRVHRSELEQRRQEGER